MTALLGEATQLLADEYGVRLTFHPHVGTAVEFEPQIDRLLAETDLDLCFDTGHHAFWNQDPLAYMASVRDRIAYMHLKNVDPAVRARVLDGSLGLDAAFAAGAMCPLPDGVVDIPAVMRLARAEGFDGPVVVEQDLNETAGRDPRRPRPPQLRVHHVPLRFPPMPLQVGLIGLGEVAQLMHLPLLADDPRFRIAAVADASPGLTAAIAARYGARPLAGASELIADPDLDAVFILTPDHLHAPLVAAAIAARKHVFVEKPVALTAAELEPLIAANRDNPKVVFVGYMRRFSRPFLELKRRLPELAAIRHVKVRDIIREAPFFQGQTRPVLRADRPAARAHRRRPPPHRRAASAASPAPTLPTTSGAPTSS